MALVLLDLGATPLDGTGTDLRAGGAIINDNFTELYADKANRLKITTRVTGATYQILVTDDVVFYNTDAQASAATMPAGAQGQTIKVINSGTSGNDLTVDGSASEKLLGLTTVFTLSDGNNLELTYDTTDGWY